MKSYEKGHYGIGQCLLVAGLAVASPALAPAFSDEARQLERLERQIASYGLGTYKFSSVKRMKEAVSLLRQEFNQNGWMGYESKAVQERAIQVAMQLISSLPLDSAEAYISCDADGDVTMDWEKDSDNNITVVASSTDKLHCSWEKDGYSNYATFSINEMGKAGELICQFARN